MILVDTSVWIDHLRSRNARLADLLQSDLVLIHPFVIGELSCGNLKRRSEILSLLSLLPSATTSTHEEVLELVARRRLYGRGIGWVDAHLITSALLTGCALWSVDRALLEVTEALGLAG